VLIRAGSPDNLETTLHAVDPAAPVSDYGEKPAAILAYATTLGFACAKVKDAHGRKAFESALAGELTVLRVERFPRIPRGLSTRPPIVAGWLCRLSKRMSHCFLQPGQP
jgi:hypothetical protein